MKRSEQLTVDLKIKDYSPIKLKQMDTTELIFKILDNSQVLDLNGLTADIIFTKPDKTIVIQECTTTEDNLIVVTLMPDCLRQSGKAKIEVEIKEDTEVVSSFYIEVCIEKTSKENIKSENTETYIERLERIIVELQTEADELLKQIETAGEEKIAEIQANYDSIVETINIYIAQYEELKQYVEEIQTNVQQIVDDKMENYLLKDVVLEQVIIPAETVITNGYEIELPVQYQVGNNLLEVRLNSEILKMATDTEDGHYKEVRKCRRIK